MDRIKWAATICIVMATCCRSAGLHGYDMALSFLGGTLWACAAYKMKDNALLTVNLFCLVILLIGLIPSRF
jgi:hypothetical protein